jgi:hypothetical protein
VSCLDVPFALFQAVRTTASKRSDKASTLAVRSHHFRRSQGATFAVQYNRFALVFLFENGRSGTPPTIPQPFVRRTIIVFHQVIETQAQSHGLEFFVLGLGKSIVGRKSIKDNVAEQNLEKLQVKCLGEGHLGCHDAKVADLSSEMLLGGLQSWYLKPSRTHCCSWICSTALLEEA